MSQHDQPTDSGESTSEFLALNHGQAWVSFYESFDKLVQENLSRSSELLRKAMTLPEVADREVAQVRDELSNRIAQHRATSKSVLSLLHEQVLGTQSQVSNLAVALGQVTSELEAMGTRVTNALKALDLDEEPVKPGNPVSADYLSGLFSSAAPPASTEMVSAAAAVATPATPVIEESEPVAAESTETAEPVTADAEPLAASEETEESGTEPTDLAERRRPHWLSVPRTASR
jgi:hypothetical protein